jgi:hypothetical protein
MTPTLAGSSRVGNFDMFKIVPRFGLRPNGTEITRANSSSVQVRAVIKQSRKTLRHISELGDKSCVT